MTYEETCEFGETAPLTAIVSRPDRASTPGGRPAVILLNAGLIHRVGPHRLHVQIARALAEQGLMALRLDLSGVGDSLPRADNLPFEQSSVVETREAMDFLSSHYGASTFLLMGLCSGARIALDTAAQDDRVAGAVLINTQSHQVTSELTEYLAHRRNASYFWRVSLFNPRSWKAALTGRVNYGATFRTLWSHLTTMFTDKSKLAMDNEDVTVQLQTITGRGQRLLMIYSKGDPSLDLLEAVTGPALEELKASGNLEIEVVAGADHTFTPVWSQLHLVGLIERWVSGSASPILDANGRDPVEPAPSRRR